MEERGGGLRRALRGAFRRLQERDRAPCRARGTGSQRRRDRSVASGRGVSGQCGGGVHVTLTGAMAREAIESPYSRIRE